MNVMGSEAIDKEDIRRCLKETGASDVGFAAAAPVDEAECARFGQWLGSGMAAGMEYLGRHTLLRRDPENVLPGVKTVISLAFNYKPAVFRSPGLPLVASYAYGRDYHDTVRGLLAPVTDRLRTSYGGEWRICIDSAPLPERYWALKAGVGKRGLNGSVITAAGGSMVFLAEILTSAAIPPDTPSGGICDGCGACLRECPTGALQGDGTVDCRKCLSYLTIECRGEWDAVQTETVTGAGKPGFLFGCDICQRICPYSRFSKPTSTEVFAPMPASFNLEASEAESMTQEQFSERFRGSAIKRAKLAGLKRNARHCQNDGADTSAGTVSGE